MRTFAAVTKGLLTAGLLGVIAALVMSFLAPASPLADSLGHFRLHLLALLAGMGALTLLLGQLRLSALAAAVIIAIGAFGLRPAFPTSEDAPQQTALTMMQLNLLFRNTDHRAVLALIDREKPDLISLQEVSQRNRPLLDALRRDYPHQNFCRFASVGGVAVLSRFPPTHFGARNCAGERGLASMSVASPDGPITIAALHLHWPYPYRQKQQIDFLTQHLRSLPRPVLLGGDFNAAPWSHAVDRVARASGTRALPGLRFTFHFSWNGRRLPIGMPIDHILADPRLKAVEIQRSAPVGSDHRAVIARLAWDR